MRIAWASIALCFVACGPPSAFLCNSQLAGAQNPSGPPQGPPLLPSDNGSQAAEVLRGLEENYLRAEMERDAALAGSILADSFLVVRSDGSTLNRQQVLENLVNPQGNATGYRISAENMRVHVFGDAACLTYTKIYTLPGSGRTYHENVLHLFTLRQGGWRLQMSSVLP